MVGTYYVGTQPDEGFVTCGLTLTLVDRNVGDFMAINDQVLSAGKHMLHCEVLPNTETQEGRGTT